LIGYLVPGDAESMVWRIHFTPDDLERVIAVHRVCPLSRVTAVLTDPEASAEAVDALTAAGCTIWQAPQGM
jgi:hypothetical protein